MKFKSFICSILASLLTLSSILLALPVGIVAHAADGETVIEETLPSE